MSLDTNLRDAFTRAATSDKALRTLINGNLADLSSLATANKTNLVLAINELVGAIGGAGASINDTTPSTSTVFSSTKTNARIAEEIAALVSAAPGTLDTLTELAAALGNDPNFATSMTSLIGTKANDSTVVKLTGTQSIGGIKTFTSAPAVPNDSFAIVKVTGLQTALDGKAASTHSHTAGQLPTATETASGIVEFANTAETTTGTDTTRAVTPAGVKAVADTKAAASHMHPISEVTNLQSTLDAKASATHVHAAADISTGVFAAARIPAASATASGGVELATVAEAQTGTDTVRAVTPQGLKAVADTKVNTADIGATNTDYVALFEAALV